MTERQSPTPHWPGSTPPAVPETGEEATISLKPLWDLFQTYWQTILVTIAALMLVTIAALLVTALLLPAERTASLKIRLLFDGAADDKYPNGSTFSPNEIIATPVLEEVFRTNDLQRFGTYEGFKNSISVLHSSVEQDMLAAFYGARIGDTKLTPVDRARLEDEYRNKREAIKDPTYELSLRRDERLTSMPASLVEKVLNDIVASWARQADELKGATRFDVPVFSRAVLTPDVVDRDFLVAADDLRVQGQRAIDVADLLMKVPGATTFRTEKEHLSLAEVRFAIRDVLRNRVEPLIYLIHERGLTSDRAAMLQYLHGHALETRLEREATRAKMQGLQDALQRYIGSSPGRATETTPSASTARGNAGADAQTLIPQIGDAFLNRLMEMSSPTQVKDFEYRQDLTNKIIHEGETLAELDRTVAYYDGLERTVRASAAVATPRELEDVKAQLKLAFDSLAGSVDRLVLIYDALSVQRLNPAAVLYNVAQPFSLQTKRGLSANTAAVSLVLVLVLGTILVPIGCAIHQSRWRRRR